jgi:ABC-type glycerol-3-phosphate transport system substrate-binding protein
MAIATLADLPWLQDAKSPVRDRFAVCRIPGSKVVYDSAARQMVPYGGRDGNVVPHHGHGGWMAGLTAKAAQVEAANDLLLFLSSPPVSQEIICETAWGGGPIRASQLDNRSAWFNYGLSPARTSQLVSALDAYYRPTLLNPTYRLRVPDQEEYLKAFAKRIVPALTQDQSPETALKAVAADWRELARQKDKAAFLHHYRMSQGLR